MPDGTRRVVGSTDATRGCKHLCRHCPIVPVYGGTFRAIPLDVVIDDVRAQVAAGAQHISFGDPDFFNGPTHARRLVEAVAKEFPGLTYDVTIKIEHILRHADMLGLLRDTGCLMITSAVESVDDDVLLKLRKGHTRADFIEAVEVCRQAGVTLTPTFVPFTPWTTIDGYVDLLEQIDALSWLRGVAPIQLAIRLLVTAESKLLELPDIRDLVSPFDAQSLTFPWRHPDPRVDELQRAVMQVVGGASRARAATRSIASCTGHGTDGIAPRGQRRHAALHDRGMVLLRGARSRAARSDVTRVLLLATTTGYQIRSFGEAAEKLGVRLVFASDRCDRLDDPWWDGAIPVRFHETSSSVEAVVASCRGRAPRRGVIAVGDRPTVLAAHVSAALGLPGNPPAAAEASRNKLATRRALRSGRLADAWSSRSCPFPSTRRLRIPLPYPVVVKPLALSGSQGVIRADDDQALARAIDRVRRLLQSDGHRDRARERARIRSDRDVHPGRGVRRRGRADRRGVPGASRFSTSPIRSMDRSSRRRST